LCWFVEERILVNLVRGPSSMVKMRVGTGLTSGEIRMLLIASVRGKASWLYPVADERNSTFETSAGPEHLCHSLRLQGSNIMCGNSPAQHHQNVGSIPILEQGQDAGNNHVVRTGEDAQADTIDILLQGGIDNHFGGLPQAGIDHFHAGIAQGAGDDLGSPVMTIEARLGNQYADRSVGWSLLFRHGYLSRATTKSGIQSRARL